MTAAAVALHDQIIAHMNDDPLFTLMTAKLAGTVNVVMEETNVECTFVFVTFDTGGAAVGEWCHNQLIPLPATYDSMDDLLYDFHENAVQHFATYDLNLV